jgi:hypothetical protein
MGAGVAQFAGTAGLEQQKSDLAKQNLMLADQLATVRESKGRQEAGDIAAKAAEVQHAFLSGEGDKQRATQVQTATIGAGATLGAAGISAAAAKYSADLHSQDVYATLAAAQPEQQARILQQNQATALAAVQTQNASDLRNAHQDLEAETAKDNPDQTKIASLKNRVTSLETSASTEAAITTATVAMYRTDLENVQHYNQQLVTATAQLNSPEMSDTDRAAQKGLVADLQRQLTGAQRALEYSTALAHGRAANATGTPPPGVAPAAPAGVPPGARYSPSLKVWQAPDGRLFDGQGQPTTPPGAGVQPPATGLINSGP